MTDAVLNKKALIGGEWVESESGERYEVNYPGDGRLVGTVPLCTPEDAAKAVAAAQEGHQELKKLSLVKRIELLEKAVKAAAKQDPYVSRILCLESGKPISQSIAEASTTAGYSWSNFHVAMANVKSFRGMYLPNVTEDCNTKKLIYGHEPVGVVVNIPTFSYPSEMPNCTIPYALALGCSVIVKPSRQTPFSAILIAEAIEAAGFPPGSINVLTGPGETVGAELVQSPGVQAINFFGQEPTAEWITANAGLKKRLMAVVSNNALVIMDDANLKEAVEAAIAGAFNHNGLSPISTRRVLVHQDVAAEFIDMLLNRVKGMVMADALDEKADIGPLNNQVVLDMALAHIEDAKAKGGKILTGGNNPQGLFLEPTMIAEATYEMDCTTEPTPGPIIPIMTFADRDQAVEMANATRFGFQTGVFTSSLENAFHLSENIQAGSIYINEATCCWDEMAPFGGVKQSGMGRMLSDWIFAELSQIKMTMFDLAKVKG